MYINKFLKAIIFIIIYSGNIIFEQQLHVFLEQKLNIKVRHLLKTENATQQELIRASESFWQSQFNVCQNGSEI